MGWKVQKLASIFSLPWCRLAGFKRSNISEILTKLFNLPGGTILPRFLFQKRYVNVTACYLPVSVTLIVDRRLMTIEWAIRQYNTNIQQFEHDVVSIRSTWQGRHGVWLNDMPRKWSVYDWLPAAQCDYNHHTVAICFRVHTPSKTRRLPFSASYLYPESHSGLPLRRLRNYSLTHCLKILLRQRSWRQIVNQQLFDAVTGN